MAAISQLINLFSILLLLIFPKALNFKRLLVYLRQYTVKGSTLGIFERQHTVLSGSKGHQSCYLGSKNIRKVLVELALYNKTHYSY